MKHETAATRVDLSVSSAALQRLSDEVAAGSASIVRGYNRTHNRHNR